MFMNTEGKSKIRSHYCDLLEMHRRMTSVVSQADLPVQLDDVGPEPATVDQLAGAMNAVRSNATKVHEALNVLDRSVNGCEQRTRALITNDIDRDLAALASGSPGDGVGRSEVELRIAYDQMQLRRI